MQFRLTYSGKLPAASRGNTRATEKQQIRRAFRGQLEELWRTHPFLKLFMQAHVRKVTFTPENVNASTIEEVREQLIHTEYDNFTLAEKIAKRFPVNDFNFLPLVGRIFSGVDTACSIDVMFLRRDEPGKIVSGGGDIDNRLKTLFDALKMPKVGELPSQEAPTAEENPFYCLVEDDSLITELKVKTDRLLRPLGNDEHLNDVHLVIHVRTELIGLTSGADMSAATAFLT